MKEFKQKFFFYFYLCVLRKKAHAPYRHTLRTHNIITQLKETFPHTHTHALGFGFASPVISLRRYHLCKYVYQRQNHMHEGISAAHTSSEKTKPYPSWPCCHLYLFISTVLSKACTKSHPKKRFTNHFKIVAKISFETLKSCSYTIMHVFWLYTKC